ncbi:MAG TPA: HD domain-containing protein, partial [Gemmatimonadales bacterium]|nr:HD domain-containing protein [Gemmatimonadales bacterium]
MIHSDRIAHALAYAAKHGAIRTRKGGGTTWPTRPANVAVLLARYGCDENTIVAGILVAMLNELPPERREEFEARMEPKF